MIAIAFFFAGLLLGGFWSMRAHQKLIDLLTASKADLQQRLHEEEKRTTTWQQRALTLERDLAVAQRLALDEHEDDTLDAVSGVREKYIDNEGA